MWKLVSRRRGIGHQHGGDPELSRTQNCGLRNANKLPAKPLGSRGDRRDSGGRDASKGKGSLSRLGPATQKSAAHPALSLSCGMSGVVAMRPHRPRCGGGRSGWSMARRPCIQLVWLAVARSSVRCTRGLPAPRWPDPSRPMLQIDGLISMTDPPGLKPTPMDSAPCKLPGAIPGSSMSSSSTRVEYQTCWSSVSWENTSGSDVTASMGCWRVPGVEGGPLPWRPSRELSSRGP